jgi:hypothetical protein
LEDSGELVLLGKIAMHFDAENDRVGGCEEGVLSDGLEDVADRDLGSESAAVSDYGVAIVSVPDVDCGERKNQHRKGRRKGGENARSTLRQPCCKARM